MATRFVTYTAFGRVIRHPLPTITGLTLVIAFTLSLIFHSFEPDYGGESGGYLSSLKNIVILVLSGYEIDQPESVVALVCSYLLVVLGIVYIAVFTAVIAAEFVDIKIRRGVTMRQVTFTDHTLLCGWVNRSLPILEQLFATDVKKRFPVVIVDEHIEEAPMDHPMIKVIRGDPTETAVLNKANASHARAAIIVTNREDCDANAADARSLLIVLAIETLQPDIYTCVEVMNPQNVVHFQRVNVDEAVSVSEVSNSLLVQAALNPGVTRLLTSMLTFGDGEELYEVPVPPAFINLTFAELSSVLMEERELVLVGVTSNGNVVASHRCRWRFREHDTIFVLSEEEPESLQRLQPRTAPEPLQETIPSGLENTSDEQVG